MKSDLDSLLSTIGRPTRTNERVRVVLGWGLVIGAVASVTAGIALAIMGQPVSFVYFAITALAYFWHARKDITSALIALIFTLGLAYFLYCLALFFYQ